MYLTRNALLTELNLLVSFILLPQLGHVHSDYLCLFYFILFVYSEYFHL